MDDESGWPCQNPAQLRHTRRKTADRKDAPPRQIGGAAHDARQTETYMYELWSPCTSRRSLTTRLLALAKQL